MVSYDGRWMLVYNWMVVPKFKGCVRRWLTRRTLLENYSNSEIVKMWTSRIGHRVANKMVEMGTRVMNFRRKVKMPRKIISARKAQMFERI